MKVAVSTDEYNPRLQLLKLIGRLVIVIGVGPAPFHYVGQR
jgi:hypothetical protein